MVSNRRKPHAHTSGSTDQAPVRPAPAHSTTQAQCTVNSVNDPILPVEWGGGQALLGGRSRGSDADGVGTRTGFATRRRTSARSGMIFLWERQTRIVTSYSHNCYSVAH